MCLEWILFPPQLQNASPEQQEAYRERIGKEAIREKLAVGQARFERRQQENRVLVKNMREEVRLAHLYLIQTQQILDKARLALTEGQIDDLCLFARNAHGSSGICGMNGILKPLKDLEKFSGADQLENAKTSFEEVEREFNRIRAFLNARFTTSDTP